ncbi:ABC transporter permease [Aeromicrobium phragmitis]|uniref:ABC transporter permease n=1 Tax=Aeromicrobium phragmitis TaxID=2478914 RepID=A0A3L8PLJ6_9ACTN|nr:ABC transporter permease [Aeromicrobium phragmitis]RLV56221.1 ABC transporter permease [Aeromicrobium phragmitis]
MARFVLTRLLSLVPVLAIVALITFAILNFTPGDPAVAILGIDATPEQREALREELGLNRPLIEQFLAWAGGLLTLDFGSSIYLDIPVSEALLRHLEPTLLLATYSLAVAILVGVPVGVLSGVRRGGTIDRLVMGATVLINGIPNFFLGILAIMLFAVTLGLLPSGGYVSPTEDFIGHAQCMMLPSLVLGISLTSFARIIRSSVLDVMSSEFVETAYAKGLNRPQVVRRHVLRNAAIPSVTVIGIAFGNLLGGAVVTEYVFNLQGIGQLLVESIARRDYPVIQAGVLLSAFLFVLVTLVVDIICAYLDPRVRYGR